MNQDQVYERTENGTVTHVTIREGLNEINHAMMAGRRDVASMSSISRTDYAIEYKDGREVHLVRVDAPAGRTEPGPAVWTGEATQIVTVAGKRYVVGEINQGYPRSGDSPIHRPRAYVRYWGERKGKAFGPTRSAGSNAKPGTVARAIWDAISK